MGEEVLSERKQHARRHLGIEITVDRPDPITEQGDTQHDPAQRHQERHVAREQNIVNQDFGEQRPEQTEHGAKGGQEKDQTDSTHIRLHKGRQPIETREYRGNTHRPDRLYSSVAEDAKGGRLAPNPQPPTPNP